MSGFEVIGLVLGIFPLVISAFEQYQHVHKVAGLVIRFEAEYGKDFNDVKDEQLFYRMTLEELLLPLTANGSFEEETLEALLADPSNPGWKDEDVLEAIEQRLGRTYKRFLEISTDLNTLVSKLLLALIDKTPQLQAKIKEKLEAAKADQEDSNTENGSAADKAQRAAAGSRILSAKALQKFFKSQFKYRQEQVRFGMGSSHRQEILKNIRKCNKKLERLLEKSDRVAHFRESKAVVPSPKAVKSLLQYWQHAERIHGLIHRSFGCTCKENHCAHLWLQHRPSPSFEFKLLLLWTSNSLRGQQLPPWDRQGLLITWKSMAAESKITAVAHQASQVSQLSSTASTAVETLPGGKKKRRVGFADIFKNSSSSSTTNVSAIATRSDTPEAPDATAVDTVQDISKLCDTMSECGMQAACIGALNDHEAGRQFLVYSQPEQKITGDEITLHDVLHGPQKRCLKRSDRFRIALAVASSHLQLRSTQWARKQWEAVDVRFPVTATGEVMFDKPYVSADFNATLSGVAQCSRRSDRSFACLGIMLLELLFGACLEDHELWQQLGSGNRSAAVFRLMVARQWAEEVEDEAGEAYSDAVMWCLNESPTTLEGEQWRRDLADRVVLPLQSCCDWIHARPAI